MLTSDELFKSGGFMSRNEGYLWYVCDAVSGDRYELRDVGCPMKTVELVFDNDNVSNILSSNLKLCHNWKLHTCKYSL